ncbi:hypothetical protein ACFV0D_40425, partial [Streptomyces sp. NPDC059556]
MDGRLLGGSSVAPGQPHRERRRPCGGRRRHRPARPLGRGGHLDPRPHPLVRHGPGHRGPDGAGPSGAGGEGRRRRLDPGLGLVPWGSALGGERLRARTDGVPGLVPLLASAGPDGREAAARHLHRHLDLCLPRDGTGRPAPAWRLDRTRGWLAEDDPAPGWTRGEAWLLLAVADALLRADTSAWRADRLTAAAQLLLADCGMLDGPLV